MLFNPPLRGVNQTLEFAQITSLERGYDVEVSAGYQLRCKYLDVGSSPTRVQWSGDCVEKLTFCHDSGGGTFPIKR